MKRIEAGRRLPRTAELLAIAAICGVPQEWFALRPRELGTVAPAQTDALARLAAQLNGIDRRLAAIESELCRPRPASVRPQDHVRGPVR